MTSWLAVDVDALLEIHSDPATMRFVRSGRPESRAETEHLVDQYMVEHATRGWTKWRLIDCDGALIGRAGFGGDAADRGLSFAIRRDHWGLGLATEVAEALARWHVAHAPEAWLHALVAVGNDASGRVLRKVGFDEVGTADYGGTICRSFVHPRASRRSEPSTTRPSDSASSVRLASVAPRRTLTSTRSWRAR